MCASPQYFYIIFSDQQTFSRSGHFHSTSLHQRFGSSQLYLRPDLLPVDRPAQLPLPDRVRHLELLHLPLQGPLHQGPGLA